MNDSVKAANLGHWFPPWTVTRAVWHKALKPEVSGVSTRCCSVRMDHSWYIITGCLARVAHASLRGKFMAKLRFFTVQAWADAKWVAKRDQIQGTRSPTSSGSPTPLVKLLGWFPGRTGSVDKDRVINDRLVQCQDSYILCPSGTEAPSVLFGERLPILPISIPICRQEFRSIAYPVIFGGDTAIPVVPGIS